MAKTYKGLLSGMFDQRVHLRDSRHAAENFGLNKAYLGQGTPRHKFQFFVSFKFNQDPTVKAHVENFLDRNDQFLVTTRIKTAALPGMSIDTETLNQYNKKKVSQTKINFEPVTITFYDSVDGKTLRLWEMYYEYYFRDGVAPEKLENSRTRNEREFAHTPWTENFYDNFGYNIQRVGNNKHLIDSISIYQVHGGRFSRTEIVRPRISTFTHDVLDYSATSELVEMRMDFTPESVIYANVNEALNADELQRYLSGDFWEMANLITIRTQVPGRNIRTQAPFPKVLNSISDGKAGDGKDDAPTGFFASIGNKIIGEVADRSIQRVQGTLGGIVDSIPNAIGSAVSTAIFGGTISFQPDPVKAIKTTVNAISRDVVGSARRNVVAAVAGAVVTGAGAVVEGFRNGGRVPQPGDDDFVGPPAPPPEEGGGG